MRDVDPIPQSDDVDFWTATAAPILELLRKTPRSVSQVKDWARMLPNRGVIAVRLIEHALDWLEMRGKIVREKRAGGFVYRLAKLGTVAKNGELARVRALVERWRAGRITAQLALTSIEALVG